MRRRNLLLTALSALMLALSRLPLHLGWMVFFAFLPLLYIFETGTAKSGDLLRMGFIMSIIYTSIVFYWIALVTIPGLIGIMIFYGFVYYILFYAINRIFLVLPRWRYLGFISIMITFEYIQNFGETRFPWFNIAYSLADYTHLIQFADIGGVVGLSALILLVNVLIHLLLPTSQKWLKQHRKNHYVNISPRKRQISSAIAIFLIFIAWGEYGSYCLKCLPLEKHEAGIFVVQPSIEARERWKPEQYDKSLELFRQLTLEAVADSAKLVIWPEGAMIGDLASDYAAQRDLQRILDEAQVDIFTGFQHYEPDSNHPRGELSYNAASLFQPDKFYNELYFKNILVPVAERMLWMDIFPFLWKLDLGQANWEFGTKLAYYESGGYRFSPSICYELAFPEIFHHMAIPRDTLSGEYHKCDFLVNITNDGWFGTSYGPWLHAMMARFRAIENRIQIYRSANTGISLIVDPKGKILARTKLNDVCIITAPLYTTTKIPIIRRIYKYPFIFVGIAVLLAIIARIKKPGG
jgi:apolipoprotein N-acyltransferase